MRSRPCGPVPKFVASRRSEEHTSELQSQSNLVCRLLLENNIEHPTICAGNRYTVFDTPHGCLVGVLICYDNNIVENARATALLGAEILLAPHQTGGCNSG